MERYQITLHSPMGPRRGRLEIVNDREAVVEVVFNTSMVGYQEILSDPSYTAQAVVIVVVSTQRSTPPMSA